MGMYHPKPGIIVISNIILTLHKPVDKPTLLLEFQQEVEHFSVDLSLGQVHPK